MLPANHDRFRPNRDPLSVLSPRTAWASGYHIGGDFLALLAAGFGFAIESLRHCGRAADVAERQHFDVEDSAIVCDFQHVSDMEFA
jgi:hypothetical protein